MASVELRYQGVVRAKAVSRIEVSDERGRMVEGPFGSGSPCLRQDSVRLGRQVGGGRAGGRARRPPDAAVLEPNGRVVGTTALQGSQCQLQVHTCGYWDEAGQRHRRSHYAATRRHLL